MKQVTIRETSAQLPGLPDEAELARVETLDAAAASLSRFLLAGTRVRALDAQNAQLADGKVRAVRAECSLRATEFRDCDLGRSLFDDCGLGLTDFGPGSYRRCDLRGNDLSALRGVRHLRRVVVDRVQLLQLAESLAADLEVSFGDDHNP